MKGHIRCIEGRMFRHDPQPDDPYLETDFGECPMCNGEGFIRHNEWPFGSDCDYCGVSE